MTASGSMLLAPSPFPAEVAFVVLDASVSSGDRAHPEELALLHPQAVAKRRRDFTLGRIAARRAIEALGETPRPVLVGPHREPLWPPGLIGSITHAAGLAAAAVARCSRTEGLGLDIEDAGAVRAEIEPTIADASERGWTKADPRRVAMLFSAKEALFKAFFRLRGELFGFEAVRLRPIASGFEATLLEPMSPRHPAGFTLPIACSWSGSMVMSSTMLPPEVQPGSASDDATNFASDEIDECW